MCVPALAALPALAGAAGAGTAAAAGTAGTLATIASIGGTVLSAGSQIAQGFAQRSAAKTNEALAIREGKVAANKAFAEQQDITRERRRVAGAQRAGAAAQGRGFSGSVLDVVQDSNVTGELDILSAIYGGQLGVARAAGNARLARASGKGAMTGALFGAGSTLLSGGAKVLDRF